MGTPATSTSRRSDMRGGYLVRASIKHGHRVRLATCPLAGWLCAPRSGSGSKLLTCCHGAARAEKHRGQVAENGEAPPSSLLVEGFCSRFALPRALDQNDRPGHQVAVLERQTHGLDARSRGTGPPLQSCLILDSRERQYARSRRSRPPGLARGLQPARVVLLGAESCRIVATIVGRSASSSQGGS